MSLLMKAKSFSYLPVLQGHQSLNLKAGQTNSDLNLCFHYRGQVANCVNQIAVERNKRTMNKRLREGSFLFVSHGTPS